MHQNYYELANGKQAVDYIYLGCLGFSYGNAFKYVVRAGRKRDNSAESDLNKALTYITSANNEYSFLKRLFLRARNWLIFSFEPDLKEHNIKDILDAIVKFKNPDKIARLIVAYMNKRGYKVKDEFKHFASSTKDIS